MSAVTDHFIFTLALSTQDAAVVLARDLVAMAFEQWDLKHLTDDGKVIMNELTTNAIAACEPDGEITARTYLDDDGDPVLEVWDTSPLMPVFQVAGPEDLTGRGLFIVNMLAKELTVLKLADGQGKVVRAVMDARRF